MHRVLQQDSRAIWIMKKPKQYFSSNYPSSVLIVLVENGLDELQDTIQKNNYKNVKGTQELKEDTNKYSNELKQDKNILEMEIY